MALPSAIYRSDHSFVPEPRAAPFEFSGVMSPDVEIPPEIVTLPVTVWAPLANVPLVLKFSSPNDMEPPESVILPVEIVSVPSIVATSETVKSSVVVNCSADTVPEDVMVKSLAIYASVISVPCQTPDERVPTASISLSFAVVITVPVAFGKVMVRSAVGSSKDIVVSKSLSEVPSNTKGAEPVKTPKEVASNPVRFEPSPVNEAAVIDPVVLILSFPNETASEPDAIDPSLMVIFPMEDPDPIVATPVLRVPVVDRFSLPKEIVPSESVIEPSESVKLPIVEVEARLDTPALNVPVVERFSSPNDMEPPVSVILPSDRARFPIEEPVSALIVPVVDSSRRQMKYYHLNP